MIAYGILLWHLSMAALLLLVQALSSRLGRAMRDDIGDLTLFTWAATLVGLAGLLHAAALFWTPCSAIASFIGLSGAVLAARAGWKTWGWLAAELRRGR